MLSEQEQNSVLHPFQILVSKFESELENTRQTFNDRKNEHGVVSTAETSGNNELEQKIRQLEKGKNEVEEFIRTLTLKLQASDLALKQMMDAHEPDRAGFASMFNAAQALFNHKYTVAQKNEINRRITAINSSRLLNNADMGELQKQWTAILGMKNDKELEASKKIFEDRLADWENLVAKKSRGAR